MRASRARRRWLRWERYVAKTGSKPSNKNLGGYHRGHSWAYSDAWAAGRYAPNGLRTPWYSPWMDR